MMGTLDTIDDGVTHIHIGRSHIDLGTKSLFTIGKFPSFHTTEEVEVFFNGTVAVRTFLAGFF